MSSSSSFDDTKYSKSSSSSLEDDTYIMSSSSSKDTNIISPSSSPQEPADMNFYDWIASITIPLKEIASATNNFADENLIAQGSYANVYKGRLKQSGELINIVVRNIPQPNGRLVVNELNMYQHLKHKNIVSLFKVDDTKDQAFMIHKHEVNQSLDKHLSGSAPTWMQRLKICVGIAHALRYLHSGLKDDYSVIHGNIKSSNILLDHNWEPKLHDFRCAIKGKRHQVYLTNKYNGASQYMDPAYENTGGLTHKSDVFSFGVLLFEVLFGRKASIPDKDKWYFAELARSHYDNGILDDMIDPDLRQQMDLKSLNIFSNTAYCCLKELRSQRPDMDQIVKKLERAMELQYKHEHPTATLDGTSSNHFKGENMDHLKFQLTDIELATNKFSNTYCIGSGGYGTVYKAKLDIFERKDSDDLVKSNKTVAIKRIFSRVDGQGEQGFIAEIEMLSKCKHQNIVSLFGFCDEGPEMILVYDYASNGSLDDYLGNADNMTNLTWAQRLQICLDIAYGLNYLHKSTADKQSIIHRDIKSANILLDENWVAKIADFGLSKLHHANQQGSTLVTANVAGTQVYLDPEYLNTGKLKTKSDIYSFGVVLFELMCGRLAYDQIYGENGLPPLARRCFKEGTLKEITDRKIREAPENFFMLNGGLSQDSLDTFSNIAYQCVAETQAERPTMEVVIRELEKAFDYQKNSRDKLHIPLEDIKLATKFFTDSRCIGEGRYWKQYEGELQQANGCTLIIAKRWDSKSDQGSHQFRAELRALFEHKHENIIGLVGYCNDMDERIIVYEHASRGSLDKYVGDASLTWTKRLKICIDVASGLDFLHTEGTTQKIPLIHRDLKTSSILLNGDWRAKIANLELSTQSSESKEIEHVTEDNAYGSLGYLCPESKKQGYLTSESDIFSLGVVLMEMMWGRPATDKKRKDPLLGIPRYVYNGQANLRCLIIKDKEQMHPKSLATFADIAGLCLAIYKQYRPKSSEVITKLKKALEFQEDYEIWEHKLPRDYKEIIRMSSNPEIYDSTEMKKDLYHMLSRGILMKGRKVWFLLGSNGARNEMISAKRFSYKNHLLRKWRSIPESRFPKVAEIFKISNLKIQIKIKTQFLSPEVDYKVHLVFKFCGPRKSLNKQMYVNLKYKKGNESLHAYFAKWREDGWMTVELFQFRNHKNDTDFEVLLESFSRCYCGSQSIYIEGIEFQALDNVILGENKKTEEGQKVLRSNSNKDEVQQLPSDSREMLKISENDGETDYQLFLLNQVNRKKHLMLSAKEVVSDSSNTKLFSLKPSTDSRLQEVIEVLQHQVLRINCKIESQMLSQDTEYVCYLVFKLEEKCRGLHCPVKVQDLLQRNNKEAEILYFRSPSPWNLQDINYVPKQRENGWMEVKVWKFNSNRELKNDFIRVNLKLISYEGTMSGLIVCGLELRPF